MERLEKLDAEQKKNQVMRSLLDGFNFTLKVEGVKVNLYALEIRRRQNQPIPLLEVDVGVIAVFVSILKEMVGAKILLKEVKLTEYYRREQMRAFSSQVNSQLGNNMLT